jgi:hypothetical protein
MMDIQPNALKATGNRASGAAKIKKAPIRSRTMTAAYIPHGLPHIDITASINLLGA